MLQIEGSLVIDLLFQFQRIFYRKTMTPSVYYHCGYVRKVRVVAKPRPLPN